MVAGDVVIPTSADWFHLAMAIVGTVGATVCSVVGLLIRVALKRAIAQYFEITSELKRLAKSQVENYDEFKDHREWVRFILFVSGFITGDGTPTGKRYS